MDPDKTYLWLYKTPSHCQTPLKKETYHASFQKLLCVFEFRSIFVDVTNKEIIQAQMSQISLSVNAMRLVLFNTIVTISLKNIQNIWNQHDFFPSSIKLIDATLSRGISFSISYISIICRSLDSCTLVTQFANEIFIRFAWVSESMLASFSLEYIAFNMVLCLTSSWLWNTPKYKDRNE